MVTANVAAGYSVTGPDASIAGNAWDLSHAAPGEGRIMPELQEQRKACILVVDDDRLIRAMLASGIRRAGYDFLEAESGEEALRLVARHAPDFALLDISLDGMSGIELARHLHDETGIPFMFLTSHKEEEMVSQAIENGALGYLVKPVDITQILPAIRTGLARAEEFRRLRSTQADLNESLGQVRQQLMQTDKLASIGQLAAGVAHEINNPIGYVHSNIGALEDYIEDLFRVIDAYAAAELQPANDPERRAQLERIKKELDLHFLREDIPALLGESKEGISRVRKIVQDLKDFSHVDNSHEWQWADLHKGIDSTLNMVNNEIKYKADVIREYGDLPEIECLPGQLNQVFMNLLVNAAHAIGGVERGRILVRTGATDHHVWVEVIDSGCGIPKENLKLIFNPFFTTKPVGKGTGLGLSLAYGIVQKHNGTIHAESIEGEGALFRVMLPRRQTAAMHH